MKLLFLSLCLAVSLSSFAQTVTEYQLNSSSQAGNVCTAPDGATWFADAPANKIGRIDSLGNKVEYTIPTVNSGPVGCAFGPADGLLYFAEQNTHKAAILNPATKVFQEYRIAPPNSGLAGVVFDAAGVLNIMVSGSSAIQRMQTDGTFLPVIQLATGRWPHGPALCDGDIWFAENTANRVAKLTVSGAVTEKVLPQSSSKPFAVTCASDGAYFTENATTVNKIGRINTTTLAITQWKIPSSGSNPMGITTGSDSNIYFAESTTDKIAMLPGGGGVITEYLIPTTNALPNKVTTNGNCIWFSERGAPQIGALCF